MLAIQHGTFAIAAALGISVYFHIPLFLPILLFVTFAGVLPDIDHPHSELGSFVAPIARVLPHRGITHSLLGALLVYGAASLLFSSTHPFINYSLLACGIFGVYLTQKILRRYILSLDEYTKGLIPESHTQFIFHVVLGVVYIASALLALIIWNNQLREQLLWYTMIGYITHLIGDWVTLEGIPLFFPFKKKFGLALFKTGSWFEIFLGFVFVGCIGYFGYQYQQLYNIWSLSYWTQYIPQ